MRRVLYLFFLSISVGLFPLLARAAETALPEILLESDDYLEGASTLANQVSETYARSADLENLQEAKFQLINGNLKMARAYLNRIDGNQGRVWPIKARYLSTISFIEGKFAQSLEYISDKRFFGSSLYPHICLLKLINYMALGKTEDLKKEKSACMFYTARASRNDQFWLDTMIKLKLGDGPGLKKNMITDVEYTLSDDEMSRLWLKTGLYLNKEKELLDLLDLLPENSYQSKRLREIVAFMYLRSNRPGDKEKALAFVDDIDSANAENIKGNINLQNREYELAFGHFRLALQKKQDSANSLERAVPLAWLLGQWTDGLSMLENVSKKGIDPRNVRAIKVAFLIRNKQFAEAQKELALLKIDFQQSPPFEVNIMDSYVSLLQGGNIAKFDMRRVEDSTEKACRDFDGISCWISLQFISWENLGKTIKRDEPIWSDKELTIESLKERKKITPIKESVTVDQKDIEELDGAGINIMPSKSP